MKNYLKDLKKKKKGFTLIELIIVLAILAVLAAIAVPNLMSVLTNSKSKADTASLHTITNTVQAMVTDGDIDKSLQAETFTLTNSTTVTPGNSSYQSDADAIESALNPVPQPQSDTTKHFQISIAATTGQVTVSIP